jgi:predicted adenine nucleotide alpha hydrolase (AANH) superfamily ATPase
MSAVVVEMLQTDYEEKDFLYNYSNWKDKNLKKCNFCYVLRLEKIVLSGKCENFDFFYFTSF